MVSLRNKLAIVLIVSIQCMFVCLIVLNATFNIISVISWRSVLLMEETGGPGEKYRPITDKLYHIMLYTSPWWRFELTTSVVIGTDCIGSCKSNYYTITATTAPFSLSVNIQYWCIDGKYRIYVARLRNGGKNEL